MQLHPSPLDRLPIMRPLTLARVISFLIVILMTIASVAGILYPRQTYPTERLLQTFVPNDWIDLFLGMPLLLISVWFTQRGKLVGLLFWPGALFYVFYNYVVYIIAMPISAMSALYIALVGFAALAMIRIVVSIDAKTVQERLAGTVPEELGGGVLVGFGILFFLRAISVIFNPAIAPTDFAVAVADLVITPAWIAGGVWLWRRRSLGYVTGIGLLFQASMLFIGLILFMLLQPVLTSAPLVVADVVAIFVMGMVCFLPFALFVRGVASKEE